MNRKTTFFVTLILLPGGLTLANAEEIRLLHSMTQNQIESNSVQSSNVYRQINIKKPFITHNPSKCDEFEDPKSIHCLGPVQGTQPTNRVDRLIQGTTIYVQKLLPFSITMQKKVLLQM